MPSERIEEFVKVYPDSPANDRIIVKWKREIASSRYHGIKPTLDEKLEALRAADEMGATFAEFPYPGKAIRRCSTCGWLTENHTRCWECIFIENYATVYKADARAKNRRIQERRMSRETISALEEHCEQLSVNYGMLSAALRAYGRLGDSIMTRETVMLWCPEHPEVVVVALAPFVPVCQQCGKKMIPDKGDEQGEQG